MVPGRTIIMGLLAVLLIVRTAAAQDEGDPVSAVDDEPTRSQAPATEEEALDRVQEPFRDASGPPELPPGGIDGGDGCDGDYSDP